MTEGELKMQSEKSPNAFLVDRDSRTRRASGWAVEFDVGELSLGSAVEKPAQRLFFAQRFPLA